MHTFLEKYNILKQLYDIPQDKEFHGEGSVGIYTEMVLVSVIDIIVEFVTI
jgi:hypothetical protein